jgi:hypothetical protein
VVLAAQLGGHFVEEGILKLASKDQLYRLPPPFHKHDFSRRKFPCIRISSKNAAELLSAIGDEESAAPNDVVEWIELGDQGLDLEDNDNSDGELVLARY